MAIWLPLDCCSEHHRKNRSFKNPQTAINNSDSDGATVRRRIVDRALTLGRRACRTRAVVTLGWSGLTPALAKWMSVLNQKLGDRKIFKAVRS
jgi:hypothetical protein